MGSLPQVDVKSFPKQVKRLMLLIFIVLIIGTIGFALTQDLSLTGAFTYTIESLAFKGHANLSSAANALSVFLGAVGVIIVWFALWTTFGLAVEGKFEDYFKEVKMKNQIKNLKDHYIVCGAGRVGRHIGTRLAKAGEKIVFVEKDQDIINRLRLHNRLVHDVGPIDERVLQDLGIERAKGIAVALGEDSKNLLLVLTAKEMNPRIKIAARLSNANLVPKFKRAGADFIILPEAIGGIKLADALRGYIDEDHIFMR